MMNFASMKFFLVGLTLTAMLSACSDDETSDLIPEPKPEQIDITFSTGELLYLPNGMLLINLFETDNTSVYQTQIKLEGIENNGA